MEVELIEGPFLIRTLRQEDVSPLYEAARESIAEVSPWLPWCHENYSIEETWEFIGSKELAAQGGEWYSFGIFEKDGGRFLGGVGINFITASIRWRTLVTGCGPALPVVGWRRTQRVRPRDLASNNWVCGGLRL